MFTLGANNTVILEDKSLLLVKEFKDIWDKDKTKAKTSALKEFAYIYLKNDFKSPYRNAYFLDELPKVLKRDLSLVKNWKPSKELELAEDKYNSLQTTKSLKALNAAENALDQITKYFDTFDITKVDKDKQADAINKLMTNISKMDETSAKLAIAKKRIAEELSNKNLSGKKTLTSRELPKNKRD